MRAAVFVVLAHRPECAPQSVYAKSLRGSVRFRSPRIQSNSPIAIFSTWRVVFVARLYVSLGIIVVLPWLRTSRPSGHLALCYFCCLAASRDAAVILVCAAISARPLLFWLWPSWVRYQILLLEIVREGPHHSPYSSSLFFFPRYTAPDVPIFKKSFNFNNLVFSSAMGTRCA